MRRSLDIPIGGRAPGTQMIVECDKRAPCARAHGRPGDRWARARGLTSADVRVLFSCQPDAKFLSDELIISPSIQVCWAGVGGRRCSCTAAAAERAGCLCERFIWSDGASGGRTRSRCFAGNAACKIVEYDVGVVSGRYKGLACARVTSGERRVQRQCGAFDARIHQQFRLFG